MNRVLGVNIDGKYYTLRGNPHNKFISFLHSLRMSIFH